MNIQVIGLSDPLWSRTLQQLRHDIYHLPEYVYLESVRIDATPEAILIVEDEKIFFVPYLLRRYDNFFEQGLVNQEVFDIISPYGYSGILLSKAAANTPEFLELAINQLKFTLRDKSVCSAFIRLHPILNQSFNEILPSNIYQVNGETVSINLNLTKAEIWHQTRPEHRNKINRCKRFGMTATMVMFSQQYIDDFITIYEETMERVGAAKSYYFSYNYFLEILNLGEKLNLCIIESNEQITCAGLFTECCGIVQYHLGGTKNLFLKQEPSKLMFDHVRFWAKERGNEIFHLGGGVGGSKDNLFHFKAGFSKYRHTFLTLRIITDEEKYRYLVDLQAKTLNTQAEQLLKSSFFPAYRCSNIE